MKERSNLTVQCACLTRKRKERSEWWILRFRLKKSCVNDKRFVCPSLSIDTHSHSLSFVSRVGEERKAPQSTEQREETEWKRSRSTGRGV